MVGVAAGAYGWLRGAYVGGGAHTLVEGRIRLAKGRIHLAKGRIRLAEGRIRLAEGHIRLSKGRIRLRKGRIRQTVGRIRLPKMCAPPSLDRSRPPLCRTRPLHMLEMLA
jgi:hypothetical protein